MVFDSANLSCALRDNLRINRPKKIAITMSTGNTTNNESVSLIEMIAKKAIPPINSTN